MRQCVTIRPALRSLPELGGRGVCCHLMTGEADGDDTPLATPVADHHGEPPPPRQAPAERPVMSVRDVVVTFAGRGRGAEPVPALRGMSLDVAAGETVGVVGESGSGKTTLGRVMLGVIRPASGQVSFDGDPVTGRGSAARLKGRLQVVLQNPDWSLNPLLQIWRSISEPLDITGGVGRSARRAAVEEMLSRVGLDVSLGERRPHELSGGQLQRVAIARAVITRPDLIVFDEAVTALDASVQLQILNLIRDLQAQRGFAAVFISHDIGAVRYVSHRIAVVNHGEIVETGPVERFYSEPDHPYTRKLMSGLRTVAPDQ